MKQVKKQDLLRSIQDNQLEEYTQAGWTEVESARKKKATKPAETAPEAAIEDLDNAIKGE